MYIPRRHLLLSALELLDVEFELLALQDISITTATLARSGRHGGIQTTTGESLIQSRVQHAVLLSLLQLSLNVLGLLNIRSNLSGSGKGLLGSLLEADLDAVVLLIPGLERSGIDLDNGVLHQSLGAHQLVVGRVVNNIKDTRFSGDNCKKYRANNKQKA